MNLIFWIDFSVEGRSMSRSTINNAASMIVFSLAYIACIPELASTPNCDSRCRVEKCWYVGGEVDSCVTAQFGSCAYCGVLYQCPDTLAPGAGTCVAENFNDRISLGSPASCVGTCAPPPGVLSHNADLCNVPTTFDTEIGLASKCEE